MMKWISDAVFELTQKITSTLNLKFAKKTVNDSIKTKRLYHVSKRIHFDIEIAQNYRKVIKGGKCQFEYVQSGIIRNICASEIVTYRNIYITDQDKIKPKALKQINTNVIYALDFYGITLHKIPVIIITSLEELKAYGLYDAVTNTLFFADVIANEKSGESIGGIDITVRHEVCHFMQAEDFRKSVGPITQRNYGDYLHWIQPRCKKRLDNVGVTSENVLEFGSQPAFMYSIGRYDEAEAEFMAKRGS